MTNLKVYLVHKKGLSERLHNILNLLCACKTIEEIEIVTSEESDLKFTVDKVYIEKVKETIPEIDFNRDLKSSEISLYHKHFKVLQKIAADGRPAIVFEDDVIFRPLVLDEFICNFHNIPLDWEFCFFGTGCGLTIPGSGFVRNTNRLMTKCTDSMIISSAIAGRIVAYLEENKACFPIDWDLNHILLRFNAVVYWYEPGIVTQGSQNGIYMSTIQ